MEINNLENAGGLQLKVTPSHLYNNLTSNGSWACYVHLSEVYMINEPSILGKKQLHIKKLQTKSATPVQQVKWVKISGKYYLVLALKNGVQVM